MGLGLIEAVALSALFVTSSNVINGGTSIWSQTASVFLVPPILVILEASIRRANGPLTISLAWLSGLFGGLLLAQDYYTGAFAALLLLLLVGLPGLMSQALKDFRQGLARAMTSAYRSFVVTEAPNRHPSYLWVLVAGVAILIAAVASVRRSIGQRLAP